MSTLRRPLGIGPRPNPAAEADDRSGRGRTAAELAAQLAFAPAELQPHPSAAGRRPLGTGPEATG
ncbi:hypothetical protein ACLB9X_34030 [Streptomyces sp. 5K101]|uniref:hypothetical protein n=1 Tax=Streptomyces sp. 5K101 TaxID=3390037 RepID=UPI0039754685